MSDDGLTIPGPLDPTLMAPNGDEAFSVHNLSAEDVPPFPSEPIPFPVPEPEPEDEFGTPDHNAGADAPVSLIDRVKNRAKDDAAKDAPKKQAKKKTPPPRTGKGAPGALVKPLAEIYTSVGVVMIAFDPACGTAVVENAESCARSLDALAQRNDSVKRALLALTETSAWGGVLAAHLPLLLMVATHHGPQNVSTVTAPLAFMQNPTNPLFVQTPEEGEPRAG